MLTRLRILPLLIATAILSFAVRFGEFVTGVRQLDAEAQAQMLVAGLQSADRPILPEEASLLQPAAADTHAAPAADSHGGGKDGGDSHAAGEKKNVPKELPLGTDRLQFPEEASGNWRDSTEVEYDTSYIAKEVYEELAIRRGALDRKEKELMTREALLQAAEQELEQKYRELEILRQDIRRLLDRQSEEEKERLQSLVTIYEGMKAKDAARIFNTLDLDILVAVMSRMSERKTAPILASMEAERARTVTIMLAEEKKLPELP